MINTNSYGECIRRLVAAHDLLRGEQTDSLLYLISRSACVKEFELVLEQSGKLLKECLKKRGHAIPEKCSFNEAFALATSDGIISEDATEYWLLYRNVRNKTAHDYGENLAESILPLLSEFVEDAKALQQVMEGCLND